MSARLARLMISSRFRFICVDGQSPRRPSFAPKLHHQHADVAVERPVQAAQAARRRIAGHAGVDHLVGIALAVEALLNQRRHRLLAIEPETGGQTVAEKDDARAGAGQSRRAAPGTAAGHRRGRARSGGRPPAPHAAQHTSARWRARPSETSKHYTVFGMRFTFIARAVTFTMDLSRARFRARSTRPTADSSTSGLPTRCGAEARRLERRSRRPAEDREPARLARQPRLRHAAPAAAARVRRRDQTAGFTDVVLLGMGGSSLAPEVLRQVVGVAPGFPRFRMLDSVDPDAVRAAIAKPGRRCSCSRASRDRRSNPTSMAAEAERRLRDAGMPIRGRAIRGDHRRRLAAPSACDEERFREMFVNPADIGGRYSALSFFGLVPAR